MDFLRSNFLRNETLLIWTFPVIKIRFPLIKTSERIRFSSNQNIGEGESNFDDWKFPNQQSFIPQEINSKKIHILVLLLNILRPLNKAKIILICPKYLDLDSNIFWNHKRYKESFHNEKRWIFF